MNFIFGIIILALFILAVRVIWATLLQTIAFLKSGLQVLRQRRAQRSARLSALSAPVVMPYLSHPVDWDMMADSLRHEIHRRNAGLGGEVDRLDAQLQAKLKTMELIKEHGCKAGLVLNPATSLACLDHVMDKLDMVLLMSVTPGYGGQKFIPGTLAKLRSVRARIDTHTAAGGQPIWLEVDGGVKTDNIGKIVQAGADTCVAGSAVFGSPDADGGYHGVMNALRRAAYPGQ